MATWRRPGIGGMEDSRNATRVGTRGSALARTQTGHVMDLLSQRFPNIALQLRIIRTTGDERTDVPLSEIGGKGLFVKELDDALLQGDVHIAVHSLKDLPAELVLGVALGAVPQREDPRDAWVHRDGAGWREAPPGTRVGTSSLRRGAVVKSLRPDLEVVPLRGNVDTRMRKVAEGDGLDAAILAAAGLNRLGRGEEITELLDPNEFVPAVGQGCLAVTLRARDTNMRTLIAGLNHPHSRVAAECERAFLGVVEGDCRIPVAGHAEFVEHVLRITCFLATPDGGRIVKVVKEGFPSMPEELGREAAEELLEAGGAEILEQIRGKND